MTDQTQHDRDSATLRQLCQERDSLRSELAAANLRIENHARLIKGYQAQVEVLTAALSGITALYDSDEGCRSLPQYVAARAALAGDTTPALTRPAKRLLCSVCGWPQSNSPGGPTCINGHGGVEGVEAPQADVMAIVNAQADEYAKRSPLDGAAQRGGA